MKITNDQLSNFIRRSSIVATMKIDDLRKLAARRIFRMTNKGLAKNGLSNFYKRSEWSRQALIEEIMANEFDRYVTKPK